MTEARDLGDTITFYLPQGSTATGPYVVFQDRTHLGEFASRDESVRFARARAIEIRRTRDVPLRLRIEDDAGAWHTTDALAEGVGLT